MTEVAYGQFLEVFEDAVAPLAESNEEEPLPKKGVSWIAKYEFLRKFFVAMETVNNSQLEQSESNMSLAYNSSNSLASLPSTPKLRSGLTPGDVFTAMQEATLTNFGSTNSLASMDASIPEDIKAEEMIPDMVRQMLRVIDEFMHNHDNTDEAVPRSPKKPDFPKFC
mmetsp:Transcript_1593/g.3426  ORF Transcript_1593/g.3426 Transcript_1593/m.3426 type:complete len:167 (-) Transcript_1593:213-713(-)